MSESNSKRDGEEYEAPLATTTPSLHHDSFSSDYSQPQNESGHTTSKEQKSDDALPVPTSPENESTHTTDFNFAVHDRAAAIMGGEVVTGPPIIGSPATTTTTTRDEKSSSRHSIPPASPPTPSRNRSRGLSLRSSLFTKSIERQVRRPELGIERHSFPSASYSNRHRAVAEQQPGKRDGTW
ncbi:hypothetical protein NU195Hw_Modified_603t1 [Hortaea werneckii]